MVLLDIWVGGLGEAFEFEGVGLEGVPLADDEVAVFEDADVVAVVDDGVVAVEGI